MKKLKVAMVVVDGNDVSGEHRKQCRYPSPSLHPAIQAMIEGIGERKDIDCRIFFGAEQTPDELQKDMIGVRFCPVPYRRVPGIWMGGALIGRFLALRRAVKDWNPDLVHAQGTERESGLVAAFCGLPSVLTLHGNFREIEKVFQARPGNYYWVAARLETLVLQRIRHVICISNYVSDLVSPFRCGKTIIPNPVGQRFLKIERPPASTPSRIVCMGTIDRRKQTKKILEACEILWKQGLNFTFHIYGSKGYGNEYAEDFYQKLQPWQENGRAFFHGISRDPALDLAACNIMVSASCEESFGMNILESMACGTPPVGPAIGGIRDIISDGKTGFLYPPENVPACAEAIRKLLLDQNLWREFSGAGRRRSSEFFSGEKVAKQTVDCYVAVLKHR